jgi:hypothetical protein
MQNHLRESNLGKKQVQTKSRFGEGHYNDVKHRVGEFSMGMKIPIV